MLLDCFREAFFFNWKILRVFLYLKLVLYQLLYHALVMCLRSHLLPTNVELCVGTHFILEVWLCFQYKVK